MDWKILKMHFLSHFHCLKQFDDLLFVFTCFFNKHIHLCIKLTYTLFIRDRDQFSLFVTTFCVFCKCCLLTRYTLIFASFYYSVDVWCCIYWIVVTLLALFADMKKSCHSKQESEGVVVFVQEKNENHHFLFINAPFIMYWDATLA